MASRAPRPEPDQCSRAGCGRDPEVPIRWSIEDLDREYCSSHAIELLEKYPGKLDVDDVDELLEGLRE